MTFKKHPTHSKKTKKVLILLISLTAIFFMISTYIQVYLENQPLLNITAAGMIITGFLSIIFMWIRASIIRCPLCKKWLTNQIKVDKEEETRKFTCKKCNIIWDSGVRLDT